MNLILRVIVVLISAALLSCGEALAAAPTKPATQPAAIPDRATLEKQFAEMLSGATLVGQYTSGDKPAKQDRYTITKAVKGQGDNWLITATMSYKGISMPVELSIPVRWAGDTPMIQMDGFNVPGSGSFTVRLLFHKDEYAGTWSAGDHGGFMWGKIERAAANQPASLNK